MIRTFSCALLIGFAGITAGCAPTGEATFAARNAQTELDLHSFVRGQSNELLAMTQGLLSTATKGSVSARKLGRDLESTVSLMDQIHMNLPSLLAAQDVEIADLRQGVAKGSVDKSVLKTRAQEVQTYRKMLLGSLDASATRATNTVNAMAVSGRQDVVQLSGSAKDLSRDLKAARTMIQMQM